MRVPSRWLFVAMSALAAALVPLACADGPLEFVVRPGTPGDGGPEFDSTNDGVSADGEGGDGDLGDAGSTPVLIGLTPTPSGDGPAAPGDLLAARLEALGTGARGVVLRRAPKDLGGDFEVAALAEEATFAAEHGLIITFSLAFVDGAASGLPLDVAALPWTSLDVVAAAHASLDAALGALDGRVRFFVLGRDIDARLAAFPDERPSLEAFTKELIAYVHASPLAPPGLSVGVGFSFAGASASDPSFEPLLAPSDVMVVSYLPGLGAPEAGPTSDLPTDADAMILRASGKPVVIESIGYPSSSVVGSSDAKQALFLDTLFSALEPRRVGFAFVNVDALHDLGPSRCAAFATEKGEPAGSVFADFACSLGIATSLGQAKPAWTSFVKGAAAFASP